MKKTQVDIVKDILLEKGEISRNECLRMYIARLAARIGDLEEKGWRFRTENRNGDYVYKVESAPALWTITKINIRIM